MTTSNAARWLVIGMLVLIFAACGSSAVRTTSAGPPTAEASPSPPDSASPSDDASPGGSLPIDTLPPAESQAPDSGTGTTAGDVPDNAVFLTYRQAAVRFSIQYVEGWQVTTQPDGVVIHDKDSSETVSVVNLPSDVPGWIQSTDLPSLRSEAGFKLIKQDRVRVGSTIDNRLIYHILSPADPVTGKQIPSTVDRFYVAGPNELAIVSLSTPDGVDNVDAFRQMIQSFRWA